MSKFSVGDRVRVIKSQTGLSGMTKYIGKEDVVDLCFGDDNWYMLKNNNYHWRHDWLKLVTPKNVEGLDSDTEVVEC